MPFQSPRIKSRLRSDGNAKDRSRSRSPSSPSLPPARKLQPAKRLDKHGLPTTADLVDNSDSEDEVDDPENSAEPPAPLTRQQTLDDTRNQARIDARNQSDKTIVCKYLPADLNLVFGEPVGGPDDNFIPPAWLLSAIESVSGQPVPTPGIPPIQFATDAKSLQQNGELLEAFNFDLSEMLDHYADTSLAYGSEFRPVEQLEQIYDDHPNFEFFRSILQSGMNYFFSRELTPNERKEELAANIERGNHKSALDNAAKTKSLLLRDVKYGFSLPVSPSVVPKIHGSMVEPCGLVHQHTLLPDGTRVLKQRLTQDLSFEITGTNRSVNNRIDMSRYPEMIYGWCLPRIIHFIVALRLAFPDKRILIAKYDFSDAYRRIAHSAGAAAQSIIIFAGIAFVALRLTFGGSPNPPTWCCFSEMITDLSNEIPLMPDWDPERVNNPIQTTAPLPTLVPSDIPIAPARQLAVTIPTSVTGRSDSFIDDLIRVFLDTEENRLAQPHAVPLAIWVSNRPNAGADEPVPRRENVSHDKYLAEGTPAEVQIVLGWLLNTRLLLVCLPSDKFIAWVSDLQQFLESKQAPLAELHSLIGRLNHAAYLIPLARHFLGRIRNRLHSRQGPGQHIRFSLEELADLKLWLKFLLYAKNGISMNLLTIRQPSQLGISDSCPYGLGGFLWSGFAWRLRVPTWLFIHGNSIANNVLEFLSMVVNIWLIILECEKLGLVGECIMALGDNTSAVGWLFRSSRLGPDSPYHKPVQLIARTLAELIIESKQCLCSQHIRGKSNTVPDLLSFDTQTRDGRRHPLAHDAPPPTTSSPSASIPLCHS